MCGVCITWTHGSVSLDSQCSIENGLSVICSYELSLKDASSQREVKIFMGFYDFHISVCKALCAHYALHFTRRKLMDIT